MKGFQTITVASTDALDTALLKGTPGADTFSGQQGSSTLSGGGLTATVTDFAHVIAHAGFDRGDAIDVGALTYSAADDVLVSQSHETVLHNSPGQGDDYSITVRRFDEVHATPEVGESAIVEPRDTSGDDPLEAAAIDDETWDQLSTQREMLDLLYDLTAFEWTETNGASGTDTVIKSDGVNAFLLLDDGWAE